MTNYVEEMMKTAGVEKYLVTTTDYTKNPINIHIEKLNDPIFTTEKQLEIIKLIGKFGTSVQIHRTPCADDGFYWHFSIPDGSEHFCCQNKDFDQALAQLTIGLINAGKLYRNRVKEILEG